MAKLQAGAILMFGMDTPLRSYGLIQSHNITRSVERAELKACDGNVIAIQEFNLIWKLDLTYIPLAPSGGTGFAEIGERFTYLDKYWQIDSLSGPRKVDGFVNRIIEATHYPWIGPVSGGPTV